MLRYVALPDEHGGRLELDHCERPEPEAGDLLVKVYAAGLNNGDVAQRRGMADPRLPNSGPRPVGMEVSGIVEAVGPEVTGWEPGQRVMGRCWGGYAEYALVKAPTAMVVPESLSWSEAASIPVTFVVAHDALVTNAALRPGESVLVNAAASGIGVATLQIASRKGAAPVIGTTRSVRKLDPLRPLGMTVGMDAAAEDFVEQVRTATAGTGVDVVIDNVGASVLAMNLEAMALEGRLVSVGRLGGTVAACDLDLLSMKRLRLLGVSNRTRTLDEQAELVRRFVSDLGPLLDVGAIRPRIEREFTWDQATAAQDYLEAGGHVGKLVLQVAH
jgi:NADPH2:quinone reductase